MAGSLAPAIRLATSPYARKLAAARGIPLELMRGSGPAGRIVAKDVETFLFVPAAHVAAPTGIAASAFAATVQLEATLRTLEGFAASGTPFDLEDMVLRAIGCALDDVPVGGQVDGNPVALEFKSTQLVFDRIRKVSLAPLRSRRLAAIAAGDNHSGSPAVISVRMLAGTAIRPVSMPLLKTRAMRLVLAVGLGTAEALLSFDAARVDEDTAAEVLTRMKAYLEMPLLLLA